MNGEDERHYLETLFLLTGAIYALGWIGLVTCLMGLAAWLFIANMGAIIKLFALGAAVLVGLTLLLAVGLWAL